MSQYESPSILSQPNMSSSSTLPVPEFIYCYQDDIISRLPSSDALLDDYDEEDCNDEYVQEYSKLSSDNAFDNRGEKIEMKVGFHPIREKRPSEEFPDGDCNHRNGHYVSFSPIDDHFPKYHSAPFQRPFHHHHKQNCRPTNVYYHGYNSSREYNPYMPAKRQNCSNHHSTRHCGRFAAFPITSRPWRGPRPCKFERDNYRSCSSLCMPSFEGKNFRRGPNQIGYCFQRNDTQGGHWRHRPRSPRKRNSPLQHWRQSTNEKWNGRGYPPQDGYRTSR